MYVCNTIITIVFYFYISCQGRHVEFEPSKAQYSNLIVFDRLQERVETQTLGKAQALTALPRVASLKEMVFKNGVKNIQAAGYIGARTVDDFLLFLIS